MIVRAGHTALVGNFWASRNSSRPRCWQHDPPVCRALHTPRPQDGQCHPHVATRSVSAVAASRGPLHTLSSARKFPSHFSRLLQVALPHRSSSSSLSPWPIYFPSPLHGPGRGAATAVHSSLSKLLRARTASSFETSLSNRCSVCNLIHWDTGRTFIF